MTAYPPPTLPPNLAVGLGLPARAPATRAMPDTEVAAHAPAVVEHGFAFIPGYFSDQAVRDARELVERRVLPELTGSVRYRKFAPFALGGA